MYAQIAPLKRLPKNLSVYDYAVPVELEKQIAVGQLVSIPFRKSHIFGIVLSLSEKSEYADKVKPLEKIIGKTPFLRESEVKLFTKLAGVYHIGLGTLLEMALPPLQKRKLGTLEVKPFSKVKAAQSSLPKFYQYLTQEEHEQILKKFQNTQTLVLVSEIQMIDRIRPLYTNKKVVTWHSELSVKQQFETWQKIRNDEVDIIIGTRSSLFLPFYNLKTILIDAEEEKDHKHWDGSPRFHVKDLAPHFAALHGAEIILTSSHPSSELYYAIYHQECEIPGKTIESSKTINVIRLVPKDAPTLIDLKSEQMGHAADYFLSTRVQEEITKTKKDIFFFLNRRGSATSVFCKACGFRDSCPTCKNPRVYHETDKKLHCHYCRTTAPTPLLCPKCGSQILMLRGYGTEQIEKTLRQIQTTTSAKIIRLDSDVAEKLRPELLGQAGQKIIIGTELAFQYLDWNALGLCVCINLDSMLSTPEYNAEERLYHLIQKIQYEREADSQFYIQTHTPEHGFWKTLQDPDLFYRTDLKKRKAFSYPPYGSLIRYLYAANSPHEAKKEAFEVHRELANRLTKMLKKGMVYDPLELHPYYFRKKYWYGIILLLEPNNWMEQVAELNTLLGEEWKVDPRPSSILSP